MYFSSKEVRNKFIEENMSLVPYALQRYSLPVTDDLLQYGYERLIKCADTFDESKGFCFSTYAVQNIGLDCKRRFALDYIIRPTRRNNTYDYADVIRLDSPINTDKNENDIITVEQVVPDKQIEIDFELSEILVDINYNLGLTDRQIEILKLYVITQNQLQVADMLNISQACVSRNLNKIKNKIRKELISE